MNNISFCTTCRNRLWQLKQTLPHNLSVLKNGMEIVLVDFGSTDGLSNWIWENFKDDILKKKLTFFEVQNEVSWHAPKAKNLAHRVSNNNYLFNIDADNFIHSDDLKQIQAAANKNISTHQWSNQFGDGSYGRIGTPKPLFFELGGYDESLLPMGVQDVDLLKRINISNKIIKLAPPKKLAVQNNKKDKVSEFTNTDKPEKHFQKLNQLNSLLSDYKLENEGCIRNQSFNSFIGLLNGKSVLIDGFNLIRPLPKPIQKTSNKANDGTLFNGNEQLFKKVAISSKRYAEYGCGDSTIWINKHTNCNIYSVDTSQKWVQKTRGHLSNKATIQWIDCGPLENWGKPLDYSKKENFLRYAKCIWENEYNPDFVLIDGRFRVLCFLITLKYAQEGTKVIFDDYINRPKYHIVEEFVTRSETDGRQCLFIIPSQKTIDMDKLNQMISKFEYVMD